MKLIRHLVVVALIVSACALSACTGSGSCCGACDKGDPCACK